MGRTTCRIVGVALGCALVLVGASVPAWALEPGSLDPSFGGDGRVDRDFGSELKETGLDMVLQADGKVVVAGGQQEGGDGKFAVARYNPGGAFDTSFHGTGHLTVPIGLATISTHATGVALTPSGKIVAAGLSGDGDFAVMRLGPGGTLDHSFSGDGKLVVGFGQDSFDEAFTTAVQPDGKILVGGTATENGVSRFALARLRVGGGLDPTFHHDGRVTTVFGASVQQEIFGMTVQDDGRIMVVGHAKDGDEEWALARYRPNGSLDPAFGGDGRVTTEFGGDDFAYKVRLLADGRLLVAGEADTAENVCDFAVARYRRGGALDTTFGGDGRVTTSFGSGCDIASGLAVQPDGKPVAVGSVGIPGSFETALARYRRNGARDHTFSGDGRQTVSFGPDTRSEFWGAAVTGSGRIVAGGQVGRDTGDPGDFILARFIG